jgi:hypothetical protein
VHDQHLDTSGTGAEHEPSGCSNQVVHGVRSSRVSKTSRGASAPVRSIVTDAQARQTRRRMPPPTS